MKNHLRLRDGGRRRALLARGIAVGAATLSPAQMTEEDETVQLSAMVVTGSNLPTAGETPVAPVTIVSTADIARTGVMNDLLQVIRKTSPQFSGNSNLGVANGNISSGLTNGASSLALRNLATLVLVNGRRLAAAPVGATGGNVFVDVGSIPVSAVERIEVLTDGASAIYGTDAVSGVVNIILKTDFEGGEAGARYGGTRNTGHYEEKAAWGVVGGQLGVNGPRVTAAYEWSKTDPLYNIERPFATPSYGTTNFAGAIQIGDHDADGNFIGDPLGYYLLDPGLPAPRAGSTLEERGYTGPFDAAAMLRIFDLSEFTSMLIGTEKKIFTLSADQKLSDRATLFGDLIFARTKTASQLNAQPLTITLEADHPANILGEPVSVRNRFVEFPRRYISDTDSLRAVGGIKGALDDRWSWETAVNYSQAVQDFANTGLVRTSAREAAVEAGEVNLFAREQSMSALEPLFGAARGEFTSELISWDVKFVGTDLLQAPGGGVSMAAGFEVREESLEATSDPDSQSATFAYDSGTTIDPFDEKRRITSLFAEMRIPLVGEANRMPGIYAADLTIAGRHERYSDTDDPTVPKIALRYQPRGDDLLLRFTFSKSFAAPTLYDINAPTGIGFTGSLPEFDSNQAHLLLTPVTELSPSRSTNYSAGVVWTPAGVEGLSVSVDYFDVEQTAVISNLNASGVLDQVFHDVEVRGAESPYAALIHYGSFTGPTIAEPGQISGLGLDNLYFVIPSSSNLGTQKLDGLDIKISYERPVDAAKIRWDSTTTYYRSYKIQVAPGAPFTETAALVTGLNGSIPRWRSYNVLTYTRGDFAVDVAHTYYSAMTDTAWSPDWIPDYAQRVGPYSVFDASVTYTLAGERRWFKGLQLTAGVNNLGNKLPPRSVTYDSLSNADVDEFNPIGRLFYVSARYRF